jgi:hypothetical protein
VFLAYWFGVEHGQRHKVRGGLLASNWRYVIEGNFSILILMAATITNEGLVFDPKRLFPGEA